MRFLILISSIIILCFASVTAQVIPTANLEKRDAEKVWENLIKAKGGRDKLHSVTNLLSNMSESSTRLDIFPNLFWGLSHRADGSPIVSIADFGKNDEYSANERGIIDIKHGSFVSNGLLWRVAVLLETKWDKPEVLRVKRIGTGKKMFDVIETIVYGRRVDFIFDPEELLVSYVKFYDESEVFYAAFLFSDYTSIDGIQMPRTWKQSTVYGSDDSVWKDRKAKLRAIKFAFNVDFDPKLFKRPLRAGSKDDWKPKKGK